MQDNTMRKITAMLGQACEELYNDWRECNKDSRGATHMQRNCEWLYAVTKGRDRFGDFKCKFPIEFNLYILGNSNSLTAVVNVKAITKRFRDDHVPDLLDELVECLCIGAFKDDIDYTVDGSTRARMHVPLDWNATIMAANAVNAFIGSLGNKSGV